MTATLCTCIGRWTATVTGGAGWLVVVADPDCPVRRHRATGPAA